jgi:hypothetical protein
MLTIHSEGTKLELPNLSRFKANTKDKFLIVTIMDGEVDEMFTGNDRKALRDDNSHYYAFMYGMNAIRTLHYQLI